MQPQDHRRFPAYFVHQLLPELFFPDPQNFFEHLNEQSLRAVWLEGNRALNERTPPDGLSVEAMEDARLIRLPQPRYVGEAVAVLCTLRPALFCLERSEDGFAVTALEADGTHRFLHLSRSSDALQLLKLVKSC